MIPLAAEGSKEQTIGGGGGDQFREKRKPWGQFEADFPVFKKETKRHSIKLLHLHWGTTTSNSVLLLTSGFDVTLNFNPSPTLLCTSFSLQAKRRKRNWVEEAQRRGKIR
ncbi:hypothetical protein SDJN03_06582, partial [Cucurbita argyrosperma subsp. sororia]